jgi:hypothetical protein
LFRIQPGRWKDAVKYESKYMRALLDRHSSLTVDKPPRIGDEARQTDSGLRAEYVNGEGMQHGSSLRAKGKRRKRLKGYWTTQKIIEEL